jgi:hypothetical protein
MTQTEVQLGSALPDDELLETKYKRLGHIDYGKVSDTLAVYAAVALPGEKLPKRWMYGTKDQFIGKFNSGPKWAKTGSYHGFFCEGDYVFRIWTDSGKEVANVDISQDLVQLLSIGLTIENIPNGSLTKCTPMTSRVKLTTTKEIDMIVAAVKALYEDLV